MPSAEERFRAKVVRRGGHEVWTGAVDARGVGLVRIDGKLRTAQRAAWEFAHGPLPPDARVNSCPAERACVRIEHLSLAGARAGRSPTPVRVRRAKGTGSLREVRPGTWKLTFTEGTTADGRQARRSTTIHGRRRDAEAALDGLRAGVRHDLGDLLARELVARYLDHIHHPGDTTGRDRDNDILQRVIEPAIGNQLAALLSQLDVERAFTRAYREHGSGDTRDALSLLRATYRWAQQQGWTDHNPTGELTLRQLR